MLDKMRQQRNMSQMKEQDKTPERLNEVEIRNLGFKKKKFQINGSENDPRSQNKWRHKLRR